MKRVWAAWVLFFRRRAAIREYRRRSEYTAKLFEEFNQLRAELRAAIELETSAGERVEAVLKNQ